MAERLTADGIECYWVGFPRGMNANEYALEVRPAAKSLGVLIRMDYNTVTSDSTFQEDRLGTPQVVIPHADWRGEFALHTFDDGKFDRCIEPATI